MVLKSNKITKVKINTKLKAIKIKVNIRNNIFEAIKNII